MGPVSGLTQVVCPHGTHADLMRSAYFSGNALLSERDAVRAELGKAHEAIQVLEDLGIPDTLEHGDLHPDNINVSHDGPIFYDWALVAVTHPFLSIAYLCHFMKNSRSRPVRIERLADSYLYCWTDCAAQSSLDRALAASQSLLPLYWAVTYHTQIMPFLEERDRWLREQGAPFHLRQFLAALQGD